MIYLEPNFGLANRMRAIASGLELAQSANKKMKIIWQNNPELNCPFYDLFEPLPGIEVTNKYLHLNVLKTSNRTEASQQFLAKLINKAVGFDYCIKEIDGDLLRINGKYDIYKITSDNKNVYIKTCGDFLYNDSFLKKFKPVAALQQRIEARVNDFTSYTIGLHIRRTDNVDAIANSPLELFVQRIKTQLSKNPDTSFYLSTDDLETEKYLKSVFGPKLLIYTKDFARDSEQGIKDAVVDLFCLSRTNEIWGSFNSSFSNIASRINQIKLTIMKS
ncbi:MAG: hypothetical protein ACRYFR_17045 [Janthinobacterium lividum]